VFEAGITIDQVVLDMSHLPIDSVLKQARSRDDVQLHPGCDLLNSMRGAPRRRLN
jgi:hypothetical protein